MAVDITCRQADNRRAMDPTPARDDAVLPAVRVAALVVVAVLLPALVILWGLPSKTADLWAWTIKPDLTPIFMGAGYGAGAYFFLRVYRTPRWHEVSVGVLSAAVFALLMLITTVIHYDKFNHGDAPVLAAIAFYGWTSVYILSPWIVAWLWRRTPARCSCRRASGSPRGSRRSARCWRRRSCSCRRASRSTTGAGTSPR
jgi:hypothetical protein